MNTNYTVEGNIQSYGRTHAWQANVKVYSLCKLFPTASAPHLSRFNVNQGNFDQRKWKEYNNNETLVRLSILKPSTPKSTFSWQKKVR